MKNSIFTSNHKSERPPLQFGEGPGVRLNRGVRSIRGLRFFTALAALALFTTCCKDDCLDPTNPDCDNYDPCYGKTLPSAKFNIEYQNWDSIQDKVVWFIDSGQFAGAWMRFSSDYTDSKYKHTWYVGSEVFTQPTTPMRDFSKQPRPQTITISHVIEYVPDLQCFPDDDGKDSVAQSFKLIAAWNDLKTFGKFRCLIEGTLDSFDIEAIRIDGNDQPANFNAIPSRDMVINWHNQGDTMYSDGTNNKDWIYWTPAADHYVNIDLLGSSRPQGFMLLDEKNRFRMRYSMLENGFYKEYRVTGRKLE